MYGINDSGMKCYVIRIVCITVTITDDSWNTKSVISSIPTVKSTCSESEPQLHAVYTNVRNKWFWNEIIAVTATVHEPLQVFFRIAESKRLLTLTLMLTLMLMLTLSLMLMLTLTLMLTLPRTRTRTLMPSWFNKPFCQNQNHTALAIPNNRICFALTQVFRLSLAMLISPHSMTTVKPLLTG